MTFETALFTDVDRHEAVDGVDGFNFQSASFGLDGVDMRNIREVMLHQTSNRWPLDRDEVEHPTTSAYARIEGRHYLSRGVSTGKTHNGRRGNQLTQAIVTHNTGDIVPYRPAQLHSTPAWRLEKAAGKVCDQWFAPIEVHPSFESEALLEWAREDPWALQVLPKYVSMLEQAREPTARKVVVIHDDLDTVLRWFALGSLLLDVDAALDLEYRAFVTDAFQNRAQLVGVHPDLQNGPLVGAHTLDLLARTISDIEVTPSARLVSEWVRRLDAFDALEVIGLARRWMPVLGTEDGAAGAVLVTGEQRPEIKGREEWVLAVRVIEGLARGGLEDDLKLYLDELAVAVGAYGLRGGDDFARAARAIRFAARSGIDGLVSAVLYPTLRCLANDPESTLRWTEELNPDGAWQWPESLDESVVGAALSRIIAHADERALPSLFVLAKPLRRNLIAAEVSPALKRARVHALESPSYVAALENGLAGDQLLDWIRGALADNLETAHAGSRTQARLEAGEWDFLGEARETKLTAGIERLSPWLAAAKVGRQPIDERASTISEMVVRPGISTWEVALVGASLPRDAELFVSWITTIGVADTLRAKLQPLLNVAVAQDPEKAKSKEVAAWISIVAALLKSDPTDALYARSADRLDDLDRKIPTSIDQFKGIVDQMAGFFGKKKKE
ncbi:hypothetical protein C5B85_11765 [Pseudoclavibacter sp. AY1F1]|uniref:GAP1-N2 domain-containing protein n=1 Tax=Pseudoclavibacter sp. AY1F1 TaxID=2080583 RepID=UPI000CE7B04B|nr:hypothetical protein [Pseudoclavibacter sp. AY1F1]PPF43820.1 hypothetical protein C5B85_11765 [Pseudoclavibacter sp. AY1F1]